VIETKSSSDIPVLQRQVSTLFQKARRKEFPIVFIAMTKYDKKGGIFTIVLECNTLNNLDKAKKEWTSEGFNDQKPGQTPSFVGHSRQKYRLTMSKNLRHPDEDGEYIIQFHPKRHNFIVIKKYMSKDTHGSGHVTIAETDGKRKIHDEEQPTVETNPDKVLTSIPIEFGSVIPPAPRVTAKVVQTAVLEAKEAARPLSNKPPPIAKDPTQEGNISNRIYC